MKHLLVALILFTTFFASAQIVTIPDAKFKNALLNYNPPIDTNGDGEIQYSEAEVVTILALSARNIMDLTGIAAFINLEILQCDENQLTELDLSHNVNLIKLQCGHNRLNYLDVSQSINLKELFCSENLLAELDLRPNINLKYIICKKNNLNYLGVPDSSNLIEVNCDNNKLSDLNISSNINLLSLSIEFNQFSTFNTTSNVNLKYIYCSGNPLVSINVSQNPELRGIDCERNFSLTALDVTNNHKLDYIFFSYTSISNIDLTQNPILTRVDCYNTNLQSLDFTQNPKITEIAVGGSSFTDINLSQNSNLKYVTFANTPISHIDFFSNINLDRLTLLNTGITELDLTNNSAICTISLKNNFSLEYINLKNGNNGIFGGSCGSGQLYIGTNPNLKFVCVEDAPYATTNFTSIPPFTSFVEDCSLVHDDLNKIMGTVIFDDDNNGCDGGDVGIGGLLVNTTDGSNNFATTNLSNGNYSLMVAENTYTTTILGIPPYFSVSPTEAVDTFVGFNQTEVSDFCIESTTTVNDLAVTFRRLNDARPNSEARYRLVYENVSSTQLSGNVEIDFDGALVTFVEATPAETTVNGNTISWDYSNLKPFEVRNIEVTFLVAPIPIVLFGDILPFTARINPITGDATPNDNVFELEQVAGRLYNPTNKTVLEGRYALLENADKYLHYVVSFQNTGEVSVINARIEDKLDEKLDWTTLKVLDKSHGMQTQMINGRINFIFDNINLPTATSNPLESQGFVAFKIKPLPIIKLYDMVANTANIYFDFNDVIITNTVYTSYFETMGVSDFESLKVVVYPNPANDILNIQAEVSISSVTVLNLLGQTLLTSKGNSKNEQIDISGLSAGNYFVKVFVGDESSVLRIVKR